MVAAAIDLAVAAAATDEVIVQAAATIMSGAVINQAAATMAASAAISQIAAVTMKSALIVPTGETVASNAVSVAGKDATISKAVRDRNAAIIAISKAPIMAGHAATPIAAARVNDVQTAIMADAVTLMAAAKVNAGQMAAAADKGAQMAAAADKGAQIAMVVAAVMQIAAETVNAVRIAAITGGMILIGDIVAQDPIAIHRGTMGGISVTAMGRAAATVTIALSIVYSITTQAMIRSAGSM